MSWWRFAPTCGIRPSFGTRRRSRVKSGSNPDFTLDDDELWQLTINSLALKGLAIIQAPDTDALRIVAVDKAAGMARLEADNLEGATAGFLKVMVQLRELPAEQARGAASYVLSGQGSQVQVVGDANVLLMADFAPQLRQALKLLKRLDVPDVEASIVEVPLQRADPTTLAALMGQIQAKEEIVTSRSFRGEVLPLPATGSLLLIAPPDEIERWRARIERFDREQPIVTEHYSPRRFGLDETAGLVEEVIHGSDSVLANDPWKLVQDGLTGTLIVTTTPAKQRAVAQLLARLESTDSDSRRPMRTYPIRNRQVGEVLELLQGLLENGALAANTETEPAPKTTAQGATAPLRQKSTTFSPGTGPPVTLTADEGTNRLIAIGEARMLDQLGPLIEALDVQEAQVLVEAMVVSLTESQLIDLGVELNAVGNSNGVDYGLGSLFGLGAQDPATSPLSSPTGTGLVAAVLDPGRFSAVVRALETVNEGRTQTMPRMLVNNNEEATLDSVLESPYTATNASNTVATTSFGGSSEAGTQISIKPQVAAGDRIVIDYSITLSGFVADSADPSLPPPKQGTSMGSVVTVPDGFTVILGGIEQEVDIEGESRVPFLGSIPLLGQFFKSRSTTKTKSRFYVFLRCNVLRSQTFEDLKYLSRAPKERAGIDENWPQLKPRVIR